MRTAEVSRSRRDISVIDTNILVLDEQDWRRDDKGRRGVCLIIMPLFSNRRGATLSEERWVRDGGLVGACVGAWLRGCVVAWVRGCVGSWVVGGGWWAVALRFRVMGLGLG